MIGSGPRGVPRFPPKMQPGPTHALEKDTQASLGKGLWSLILFENCGRGPGTRDYAAPARKLLYEGSGEAPIATSTPFGGTALSFGGDTTDNYMGLALGSLPTPTDITCSFLSKFDGTGVGGKVSGVEAFYDPFGPGDTFRVLPANDQWTDGDGNTFLTPAVTALSGWTRITVTWDGATSSTSLFVNGKFASTGTMPSVGFLPSRILGNWPWPTKDFFFWFNRELTPTEVSAHAADPYGTTLRPKCSPLGVVGTAAAAAARRGLLLRGVGP